jgi:hypothetical protein
VTDPSSPDAIAADALFVAQGLESDNLSLAFIGWDDFAAVYLNSPAASQPQLRLEFFEDMVSDLM